MRQIFSVIVMSLRSKRCCRAPQNQYGLEDILAFKAGYNISDSEVSTVGTSGNNSVMAVSYTHLDVYKRQGQNRHIIILIKEDLICR